MTERSSVVTLWRNFKEVILLARFVYLTICEERHNEAATFKLKTGFYAEYRYIESFGRCFLQEDGYMKIDIVGEAWVKDVGRTISKLKKCYFEYSKVALSQDGVYQQFSPFVNRNGTPENHLGYKGFSKDLLTTEPLDLEPFVSLSAFEHLWGVQELQNLLKHTQICTDSLNTWAPLIMATDPRYCRLSNCHGELDEFLRSDDAKVLKLQPHVEIRKITSRTDRLGAAAFGGLTLRCASLITSDIATSSGLASGHLDIRGRLEPVLFEYKRHRYSEDYETPIRSKEELLQLAQLLVAASSQKSDLHTLRLRGIIDQTPWKRRFVFVFDYPKDVDPACQAPISLHAIMKDRKLARTVSLQDRFHIAQTLAKTIVKFHADGWVHKNIQSRSVVFFHRLEGGHTSRLCFNKPHLVDFECARPIGAQTTYTFDVDLENNIYRHPARQGKPSESFKKVHDCYALGVVLLEIGLWASAMDIFTEQNDGMPPTPEMGPRDIQRILLSAARERLKNQTGSAYAEAVDLCLDDYLGSQIPSRDAEADFVERVVRNLDIGRLQPVADL